MAVKKVLVIDDSSFVRLSTTLHLQRAGYKVVALESAVGATTVLRAEKPDLVLLDLNMPGLEGDEFLTIIRGLGIDTKVLLYSAAEPFELEMAALESGADGFLQKCAPEALVKAIDSWLRPGR